MQEEERAELHISRVSSHQGDYPNSTPPPHYHGRPLGHFVLVFDH